MTTDTTDAVGLAQRIRKGELSAAEAVSDAIRRIEGRNPAVNAVVHTRFDQALEEAAGDLPDGPLAGVPFLVKDLLADVAGMPSTWGSRLYAGNVPARDSALVARYRQAGLVILGATSTPEFGKNASTEPLAYGPVRNPWLPTHSAGGSSGGSAAAVASGMVLVAHGNDGGGSIRIPASMCGLFGLKPTRGRVPTAPYDMSFAYPLAAGHALTTTVRDSAVLLDVAAGPVPGVPGSPPPGERPYAEEVGRDPGMLRVALATSANGNTVDPDCVTATEAAGRLCESLGHRVELVPFSYDADAARRASGVIMGANVVDEVDSRLAVLGRELREDDIEPFTRALVDMGRSLTATQLVNALQTVERLGRDLASFFERYDVLVTPTLSHTPPPLGTLDTAVPQTMFERAGAFTDFTAIFNATGQPAMSVPLGTAANGTPVGVQFATALGGEGLLFRLAAQLERAAPWPRTAPDYRD